MLQPSPVPCTSFSDLIHTALRRVSLNKRLSARDGFIATDRIKAVISHVDEEGSPRGINRMAHWAFRDVTNIPGKGLFSSQLLKTINFAMLK